MKISAEMAECLGDMHEHGGVIRRHTGGFWRPGDLTEGKWYSAQTIKALVSRGRIEWSDSRLSEGVPFYVEAKLCAGEYPEE